MGFSNNVDLRQWKVPHSHHPGPGKLSLLSYQGPANSNANGSLSTTNAGVTRFLISFSHNYTQFAFQWDGAGEAVYSLGNGLERKPVGKSWTQAGHVAWGASVVDTQDVTSIAASALDRTNNTTVYIIPDLI
ncbi:hypothetical protein FPV67DRAFT_1700191 [Lyophyllum atratum]|nr:hypothetical protein FPV67DRAFT_1700191 [Lyophyllum atratum]